MKLVSILQVLTLVLGTGVVASAAEVGPCDSFKDIGISIGNGPSFSNGEITTVNISTEEPACCDSFAVINVALKNGGTQCFAVGQKVSLNPNEGSLGYQNVGINNITGTYDPQTGLTLSIPVAKYIDGIDSETAVVKVNINRSGPTPVVTIVE